MKKLLLSSLLVLSSIITAMALGHTVSIVGANVTCFGACNGSATATVSGGVGPFVYDWTPGTPVGDGTNAISGMCPGSYTVTVTDNSDLSIATASVTINEPTQIIITLSTTNVSCSGGADGTIAANVTGGTPGYTYLWMPGGGTTPTMPGLSQGSYTLTVTDMNGCIATAPVIISGPPPLIVTTSVANASCGMCDGQVGASISGGTASYSFVWAPGGQTTPIISGLCPGTHTITVTDANGCMANATGVVNTTLSITGVSSVVTNATCGNSDGAIALTSVNGGTPPFTYSWSPGGQTNDTISNLPAGTYTLSVSDSLGCTYSTPISVINASGPTAVATTIVNSNCSSPTGQINIGTVTGGIGPYTYSLNGGAFTGTVSYTSLAVGVYNLGVQDANLCVYYTGVTVSSASPVITLDTLINASCSGGLGGSISIIVTGGTLPYTFAWSNGASTQNITAVLGGAYSVTVSDSVGCISTQSFFVANSSVVYASVTSSYASCGGTGASTVYAAGGTPPYSYSWNSVPVQTTQTATGLNPGTYICTITDANGCYRNVFAWIGANCYNIIKGRIYNDINGNCIQDAGDLGIAGRTLYSSGTSLAYGYTNTSGDYTIYTTSMNNTITQILPLYSVQICPIPPANQIANFTTLGDTIMNVDFANQYLSNVNDLRINYYPGVARPGFNQSGYLWYRNQGTAVINSVTINLAHDSILTYNYSTPTASTSYTYPNIGWNIGTINPGQSGIIYTIFTVPVIASGGYLGRVLNYSAQINPIVGDTTPVNNVANATRIIVGAYDPNDKAVSPAGNILATDSVLSYTIRFQNSGTDTAFTVVLKDTLSQYLDPATVEPGIASHPYTFNISFNGELTWTFNNILLPDSTTNEPASHGFALFTVKQRPNNPLGTQIENTAHIYFDFNEAVVTNTVSNTIVDITTVAETFSSNNAVKVYPNPFSDNTTFVINSEKANDTYSFELTDVLGKKVKSINGITTKQFEISRNGLENGIYFYKIYSSESIIGVGKVVIK